MRNERALNYFSIHSAAAASSVPSSILYRKQQQDALMNLQVQDETEHSDQN